MTEVTRPVLKYFGGKWALAPWVIEHFPPHSMYVEAFGGGGSVLMRKKRAPIVEVYNDLDEQIVNLFRVLRDPEQAERLRHLCYLTPWSRLEFKESYVPTDDPIEWARRVLFRAFAGFGSSALVRSKTGFRSKDNAAGLHAASAWANWPDCVPTFVERLRGVVIECRDAAEVIGIHDSPETLIYADPPYVHETRNPSRAGNKRWGKTRDGDYTHEMTDDDHRQLAVTLRNAQGYVLISGYACELYDDELFADWHRVRREHTANGGSKREEVLWLNYQPRSGQLELGA